MDRLEKIEKMLTALMRHEGLMQWVDCWAFGSNEGGRYVSLFHKRASYRLVAVYEEQFGKLPEYVHSRIPEDCGGEISTERGRVEKAGRLIECPPFCITRYSLGSGDDTKWRFGDVLWASSDTGGTSAPDDAAQPKVQESQAGTPTSGLQNTLLARQERRQSNTPQPQQRTPHMPVFSSVGDALDWALSEGAFADRATANAVYTRLKKENMPHNAGAMYALWIGHVSKLAKRQHGQAPA